MRTRIYQEIIKEGGFTVTGNLVAKAPRTEPVGMISQFLSETESYQPITLLPGDEPAEQFYSSFIQEMVEYGNVFHEEDENDPDHIEFIANYKQIIRGEVPHWRLVQIEIAKYDTTLFLAYQHTESGKIQDVVISTQRDRLSIRLELPPNSMGFSPKYYITLRNRPHLRYNAVVWEDLGYVCRKITVGKEEVDDDGGIMLEVEEVCGL